MAEGIQKGFQYLLIVLGIIVVVLAVWMAKEHMWWIAVPDACFGIGVAWFAWTEIADHGVQAVPATAVGPGLHDVAPQPAPAPEAHAEAPSEPAPANVPSPTASQAVHTKKKKKRRH